MNEETDQPQEQARDDDGLVPPPAMLPLAISQTGTETHAKQLQIRNAVPERFHGSWFHETYDRLVAFNNQQEDWTWFTRSPTGGTIWGEKLCQVYMVAAPKFTRLHATGNKGDSQGYEGDSALPDWWMAVGREDIEKLMVVATIDPKTENATLEALMEALMEAPEYKAIRQASIAKLPTPGHPD